MTSDNPAITFVNSFMRNICLVNNGNTHPPALCAGEASDEKLKIDELGSKFDSYIRLTCQAILILSCIELSLRCWC